MSQSGFTPIQLFRTSTAAAVPTAGSLAAGELAINLTDEKLYFKNAAGVVKLLASTDTLGTVTSVAVSGGTTGLTTSGGPITTSGTITLAGTLGVANGGTGVTTSTGTGSVVLSNSPTLVTPTLGAASATSIANALGAVGTPSYTFTGDTNTGIYSPAADTIAFVEGGVEAMRLDSSGNVGIGTNSPGTKLDILGAGNPTLTLRGSDGAYSGIVNIQAAGGGTSIINATGGSNVLGLYTNTVERMRIDSSGNVGIGTSSILAKLHVAANATYQQYLTGTDINQQLRLGYDTTNNVGKIQSVQVGVGFKDLALQPEGGNVGIGTSSPRAQLDVGTNSPGTTTSTLHLGYSGLNFYGYRFTNTVTPSLEGGGTLSIQYGTSAAWVDAVTVKDTGNVGIGTSSPGYKVDVAGIVNTSQSFRYGASYFGSASDYFTSRYLTNMIYNVPTGSGFVWAINGGDIMTLNSSGNVGIGTSSPGSKLEVAGSVRTTQSSGGLFNMQYTTANAASRSWQINHDVQVYGDFAIQQSTTQTGNTYADRLLINNAGDVGIGTSSPGSKLHVSGTEVRLQGSASFYSFYDTAGTTRSGYFQNNAGSISLVGELAQPMTFWTSNTERMRIDSSGNVGIGTTTAPDKLTVAGGGTFFTGSTDRLVISPQTAGSGALLLASNAANSAYAPLLLDGSINVFRTVGTERMRIDSSGNVGIGTTIPGAYGGRLTVGDPGNAFSNNVLLLTRYATATLAADGVTAANGAQLDVSWASGGQGPLRFTFSSTERMRLTSGGFVGIGTSSPQVGLHISFADQSTNRIRIQNTGIGGGNFDIVGGVAGAFNSGLSFFDVTNSATRAVIDSSGNFMVAKNAVQVGAVGAELRSDGGTTFTRSGSTNATSTLEVYSTGAAAFRFFVDMAGNVNATSTSISAISDVRLKENVRDLDAGLDTILALKPRRFDWKEGKGKDVKDDMGFIAQEVEEVLPALIGGWKAGEGEPDDLKSVKAGDLIPVLVKAIQELTARVAQLEGN